MIKIIKNKKVKKIYLFGILVYKKNKKRKILANSLLRYNETLIRYLNAYEKKLSLNIKEVLKEKNALSIGDDNRYFTDYTLIQNYNHFKSELRNTGKKDRNIFFHYGTALKYLRFLKNFSRQNLKIIFVEQAFLSGFYSKNVEARDLSYIFDTMGFHYIYKSPSTIEKMLNDSSFILDKEKKERARNIIKLISDNNISKFNDHPSYEGELPGDQKKKVLIIGQKPRDASIVFSNVSSDVFHKMIEEAIEDNPDSDVLIKEHPSVSLDSLLNVFPQHIREKCFKLPDNNLISILKKVNKVYVCSSSAGLEALMLGKEVVTFGVPFYSGWGLTDDRNEVYKTNFLSERRSKKVSLEEMVYRVYIDYSIYKLPNESKYSEAEDVINYIIKVKKELNIT